MQKTNILSAPSSHELHLLKL
jgi:mitogen-activated protein kinase 1/3